MLFLWADFWMIKSAQNVIGSVMCCPGCFSLYRASAINDVVGKYSEPTTRAGDVFTKDTGIVIHLTIKRIKRGN